MLTTVVYKLGENIYSNRAYFKNIYFINGKIEYFSLDKDIKIEKLMISNNEFLDIEVKYFENINEIKNYLLDKNIKAVSDVTTYCSHFYDWNVAHGLYDTLYPIYLLYLHFLNNDEEFNIFLNLKFIQGWRFPGISSRDWVLNIFKKFCGGNLIVDFNKNYKFENLLIGHGMSGLTMVTKHGEMPGKELNALEKFRDRMYIKYNITKNINNEKLVIRIIDNQRYTEEDKKYLWELNNELNLKGYDSEYISWKNIVNFKDQLELMNKIDIHISGCGTGMLNFPFLNDNKVHINLGANPIVGCNIPGLMEINIMLLSNNITCDFYNIIKYKHIVKNKLEEQVYFHIDNLKKNIITETKIPKYIKIWREYCKRAENIDIILKKMNGLLQPHYMGHRWIECLVYNDGPFASANVVDMKILNEIKNEIKNE